MRTTQASLLLPAPAVYFPITDNRYSTRAALTKFGHDFGNGQQDKKLFQLDTQFSPYRDNKLKARKAAIHHYVCTDAASSSQLNTVTQFILQHLCDEYPEYFSLQHEMLSCQLTDEKIPIKDENLFDTLSLQVQEDICVMEISESNSTLLAAHLCAANHWSAREKLGMDMLALHQYVPGFSKENREPNQLVAGLYNKTQPYVRFAWGLSEQPTLNQHPMLTPNDKSPIDEKVWLRIERQVIYPIPDTDLMLFTIRTYFRDCDTLDKQQRISLISAINSMSDDTLKYKNINKADVINRLKQEGAGLSD